MKLNTSKEIWIARIIVWLIIGGISIGIIFVTTFMLGPSLFVVPNLDEKITMAIYCPSAESTSLEEGASTQTIRDLWSYSGSHLLF